MALAVKDLIDAGVHFGHRASRWNPKMKPYIYGKRNLIHIIDLKETVRGLLRATKYFHRVASNNGLILFVGTKRQAAELLVEECPRAGMPFVTERWLGGTLTNFRTIRSRLDRLGELEQILDSEQALSYSKKMVSTLTRERRKIARNLEGIRHMTRLPEALFVIDPHRERIAVNEARKLGIKVVALLDTDCDPDVVDLPIPGNDDSMRSIELVVKRLIDAIVQGRAEAPAEPPPRAEAPEGDRDRGGRGGRGGGDRGGRGGLGGRGGGPGGASRGAPARTGGAPVAAPTAEPAPVEATPEQAEGATSPGTEAQAEVAAPAPDATAGATPEAPETPSPADQGEPEPPPSAS